MTVRELIKELKKMPKDLHVGYSHHDNGKYEIPGWVENVAHLKKIDYINNGDPASDDELVLCNPDEWVILNG